jgi:hypothetical protein
LGDRGVQAIVGLQLTERRAHRVQRDGALLGERAASGRLDLV